MIKRTGLLRVSGQKIGSLVLAAVAACCFSAPVLSEAGQRYLVGVEGQEFMPYSLSLNSDYQGFHRELLDLFASAQGIQFDYIPLTYIRNSQLFLAGQLDFQFPDDPAWIPHLKGGDKIYYSAPAVSYIDGVMLMSVDHGEGLDQLKRLGILRGWTPSDYYQRQHDGLLELVEQDSLSALVHDLLQGNIDGIYINQKVMERYLRRRNLQTVIIADDNLPYRKSGFSLASIQHPELIEAFDQFLVSHAQAVESLKARYQLHP